MLSNDQLLDRIVSDENDQRLIDELSKRLKKKHIEESETNAILDNLKEVIKQLNDTDLDLIGKNELCENYGREYWHIRRQILEILSTGQLPLFVS